MLLEILLFFNTSTSGHLSLLPHGIRRISGYTLWRWLLFSCPSGVHTVGGEVSLFVCRRLIRRSRSLFFSECCVRQGAWRAPCGYCRAGEEIEGAVVGERGAGKKVFLGHWRHHDIIATSSCHVTVFHELVIHGQSNQSTGRSTVVIIVQVIISSIPLTPHHGHWAQK